MLCFDQVQALKLKNNLNKERAKVRFFKEAVKELERQSAKSIERLAYLSAELAKFEKMLNESKMRYHELKVHAEKLERDFDKELTAHKATKRKLIAYKVASVGLFGVLILALL